MIIKNNILPFKGFSAMAVWPFIFVRKDWLEDINSLSKDLGGERYDRTVNHEKIHFRQQKELLLVGFYILYLIFWLIYGYRNIPFEREAYKNQDDFDYLSKRKLFAFLKYLKK